MARAQEAGLEELARQHLSVPHDKDATCGVTTAGGIVKGAKIRHDKGRTIVMIDASDGWKCAAFQNTKKKQPGGMPPG